jgi:hypothetical protein
MYFTTYPPNVGLSAAPLAGVGSALRAGRVGQRQCASRHLPRTCDWRSEDRRPRVAGKNGPGYEPRQRCRMHSLVQGPGCVQLWHFNVALGLLLALKAAASHPSPI